MICTAGPSWVINMTFGFLHQQALVMSSLCWLPSGEINAYWS